MVELIYLRPGEKMPQPAEREMWITVEADDNGLFYGTGCGIKPSGEDVFYISLSENDLSLEAAIAAATDWAGKRGVSRIWVQTTPD